jgi:hypothetical protein
LEINGTGVKRNTGVEPPISWAEQERRSRGTGILYLLNTMLAMIQVNLMPLLKR